MTTVPLTAPGGENQAAEPARPVESDGEVGGIRELSERVVFSMYRRFPWLHKALLGMLVVFTGTCLVAVVTRLSPLPLLPLPLFAISGYTLWRIRDVRDSRGPLLTWSLFFVVTTAVGFWLMSVIARWVS
ncbi:hypothetical protein [Amycolatopsis sp. NPDC059021]|uniref:hypothetical protein n=1 Tax=Amycolatopsis sp. NPDC059021 TaxID=3346704 RepID=UPI00366D62E3